MIGAGVYVTDIERVLAAAEEDIDEAMTSAMGFILLVTIVVVIISLIVGLVIGRTVTAPLNKVSDMMQEIADGDGDLRRRFNHFVVKMQNTIREVGATTD